NRRHHRHGQLFQNRYKSILCQADLYLLELVRYIHLNPFRAGIVRELKELDKYPYGGHSVMMGRNKKEWQDTDYILGFYDRKRLAARRHYREYVEKGIGAGQRPDLIGGGLVRSAGGWSVVKAMRKGIDRIKGDERILGDGVFVESVLKEAQEGLERKSRLQAHGYGFDWLVDRVAQQLGIGREEVLAPGKYPRNVRARSLLCYWGTRELGMTTVELSLKLNLSQPTISQAAARGKKIAQENGFCLMEEEKQ
ncbi:MAG: transposase, partial [Deltaproteobacteria bacterium]|nr:transposase [Deltaproteobacteria bacterium]